MLLHIYWYLLQIWSLILVTLLQRLKLFLIKKDGYVSSLCQAVVDINLGKIDA